VALGGCGVLGIELGVSGHDENAPAPHGGEGPDGVKPTTPQARDMQ
jgi:hypothetical protein